MSSKKILIILILSLFIIGIYLIYNKKIKQKSQDSGQEQTSNVPSEQSNENGNSKKEEITRSDNSKLKTNEIQAQLVANKIERFNPPDNIEIKTKYSNKEDFIDYLKNHSHFKIPNKFNNFFVDNVVAVPKDKFDPKKEYLWKDSENIFYNSSATYQNYNHSKYAVLVDKETKKISLSNGVFILKYESDISHTHELENKFSVKVISNFKNEKLLIVRANQHSNLLDTYKNLKNTKIFTSVELELTSSYEKLK